MNGINAYIFLNGESDQNKKINDPSYNKNYLTVKPAERARSCSPAIQLHEQNITQTISPTNLCLEQSIKENMNNLNTTTTIPVLKIQTNTVNKQACDPLTKNSESLNVFNTKQTTINNDGTLYIEITCTLKSPVLPGMLRYEARSPISSINDSDESSDLDGIANVNSNNCNNTESASMENNINIESNNCKSTCKEKTEINQGMVSTTTFESKRACKTLDKCTLTSNCVRNSSENRFYAPTDLSNVPQNVLLQLIEAGHLEVHTEEDGSGHQYVAIPLPPPTVDRIQAGVSSTNDEIKRQITSHTHLCLQKEIKEEH